MKNLIALVALLWSIGVAAAAQDPIPAVQSDERDKALLQSAFDGELTRVRGLVKKGASLEAAGPKKRTAMIWAAANGHTPVVEFLHGAGADINAKDSGNQTALMFAIKKSYTDTVEYLLENGADVNVRSAKQGFTALMLAAAVGDVKLVRLLLDHGADKNLTDRTGNTAADRARQWGNADIVPLLEDSPDPAGNS